MASKEEFIHCTVCRTKTAKFTVIKEDRLCSDCLSKSAYGEGASAFKIEFLDASEKDSNRNGSPIIKTEPNCDDRGSTLRDQVPSLRPINAYRSGSLPEGVVVQIANDISNAAHNSMVDSVRQIKRENLDHVQVSSENANFTVSKSQPATTQLDQPIQIKQEQIESDDDDMQIDSPDHSGDSSTDANVKEEITVEEPCLTEVQLGPVERKPLVKCPQCDKSFLNRAALHKHEKRMHQGKPLSCDVCSVEFANTDRLNYHKRTAHASPQLQCPQCPKKFALPNGLKKHILTHTTPKKDRRPECEICGRKFKSRVRLQQHMERKTVHVERTCPVCGAVIMGYERYEEHLATHPKPPKTPNRLKDFKVPCKYCDHKTTSKTLLRKHNDECHAEEKTIRCRICFIWCNGKVLFEQHVQEEHQGNQRQCDICLEGCVELAELEEHKKKCPGRILFQCENCQENYVERGAAQKHLEKHETTAEHEYLILETRSLQKIFTCALCGDDRGYEEVPYNTHVKEVHNGYHILCPDCGAKFRLHRSFVNHRSGQCMVGERAKEKVSTLYAPVVTQCLHCPRSFKNRWRMEEHIRRIHKAKPADCDICGLKLASVNLLKSHKLSVHTEANFQCPHCEKKFASKYHLQGHMLSHQESSHLCEECGGKYKTKQILNLHIKRVHNPDKASRIKTEPGTETSSAAPSVELVRCEICGKDFKGPVRLRVHMNIHDPNRKQYHCEMCEATFVTRIGLRQHMANPDVHHEVTCAVCNTYFRNRERYEEHMLKHADEVVQE